MCEFQVKKSITTHLCTVSDFAIDMFDVLDAINYQSYNDFVLRVGECRDSHINTGAANLWRGLASALTAGKFRRKCITETPHWPLGSSSQLGLKFWAPLCWVSCGELAAGALV